MSDGDIPRLVVFAEFCRLIIGFAWTGVKTALFLTGMVVAAFTVASIPFWWLHHVTGLVTPEAGHDTLLAAIEIAGSLGTGLVVIAVLVWCWRIAESRARERSNGDLTANGGKNDE